MSRSSRPEHTGQSGALTSVNSPVSESWTGISQARAVGPACCHRWPSRHRWGCPVSAVDIIGLLGGALPARSGSQAQAATPAETPPVPDPFGRAGYGTIRWPLEARVNPEQPGWLE